LYAHPIFDKFRNELSGADGEFIAAPFNQKIRRDFISASEAPPGDAAWQRSHDYYKWIDMLEAVDRAEGSFAMIDLGAGFGRWLSAAALAAAGLRDGRRLDLKLVAVEADDRKYERMATHLQDNGVDRAACALVNAVLSDYTGYSLFPKSFDSCFTPIIDLDVRSDQIQAHLDQCYRRGAWLITLPNDMFLYALKRTISVVHAMDMLPGQTIFDLLSIDIQGGELLAIQGSLNSINERIKKMHIRTTSRFNEFKIYKILTENNWVINRIYNSSSTAYGEFGDYWCEDGLISCVNGRFMPREI